MLSRDLLTFSHHLVFQPSSSINEMMREFNFSQERRAETDYDRCDRIGRSIGAGMIGGGTAVGATMLCTGNPKITAVAGIIGCGMGIVKGCSLQDQVDAKRKQELLAHQEQCRQQAHQRMITERDTAAESRRKDRELELRYQKLAPARVQMPAPQQPVSQSAASSSSSSSVAAGSGVARSHRD